MRDAVKWDEWRARVHDIVEKTTALKKRQMNAMLPDRKLFHPKVLRRPTEDAHYFKIKINIEMRRASLVMFSVPNELQNILEKWPTF